MHLYDLADHLTEVLPDQFVGPQIFALTPSNKDDKKNIMSDFWLDTPFETIHKSSLVSSSDSINFNSQWDMGLKLEVEKIYEELQSTPSLTPDS